MADTSLFVRRSTRSADAPAPACFLRQVSERERVRLHAGVEIDRAGDRDGLWLSDRWYNRCSATVVALLVNVNP
jgi:hypothetical protein